MLIYLILFSIYFPFCFSEETNIIKRKLQNEEMEITLKIFGSGEQFIVYEWCYTIPNQVLVNGVPQSSGKTVILGEEGEYNITLKWNTPPKDFNKLFFFLENILEVDLSKMDTSQVTTMASMFKGCTKLTSINFGNINTSKVEVMAEMFFNCTILTSLNLNGLDTSNVNSMLNMFYLCRNLKELHLDNFNTDNVTKMNCMFYECNSLTTLDLSSFRTSSVTDMSSMFQNCQSLISLNVDNFDTSQVVGMNRIFLGCNSLISLNINSFDFSKVNIPQFLFSGIESHIKFCVDPSKSSPISELITSYENNCADICFTGNNLKFLVDKKECIDSCENDDTYQYEYENICYENCPGELHPTIENIFLCQEKPEYYYLDINDNIFKPCYESCNTCNGEGNNENHNCIDCKSNYRFLNETNKENNCYEDCTYLYYFQSDVYKCTNGNNCPSNYNKLIEEKNKCIDNCENDDTYQYEYENECYVSCPGTSHYSSDNMFLCQDNPEGYYLDTDENMYKPCYITCQTCSIDGNANNHNCDLCISGYNFIDDTGYEKNCYPICDNYYFDSVDEYHCNSIVTCTSERPKYIKLKNICIDECKNDDTYQVEFNNECYITCPNNTHVSSDNMNLCRDNPESYYLDTDNIFKPCHEGCKSCNGPEISSEDHNCIDCKSNYLKLNEMDKPNNCYAKCQYFYYFDSGVYTCTSGNSCPSNYNKQISEKNKCIDNCENDDTYYYEYNNKCYLECQSGSHLKNDSSKICYKDPEGYYLDSDNYYKPCYSLCKTCNGPGDKNNNNCKECLSNYILILNPQDYNNCFEKCEFYYYFDSSGSYKCTANNQCPEEQSKLIKTISKCIDDCSKDEIYKIEDNNICVKFSDDGTILICPINIPFEKQKECVETCTSEEFLNKECILNNKDNQTQQNDIIQSIKTDLTQGRLNTK